MSETAKHRKIAEPYCAGNGIDIGSSGEPIVPWAIQLDLPLHDYVKYNPTSPDGSIHWRGDSRDLPLKDGVLDRVALPHVLEDFQDWWPIRRECYRVLKID